MNNPMHHLKVELISTSRLTPNPRNARKHPDKQIAQLAANIKRFGMPVPIVTDQNYMILAGHGRWEACKKNGFTEVPVIRTQFLNEEERRAFALADNKLAELSHWNQDILADELGDLFDSGFDISSIGFSTADLDFAIVEEKPAKRNKAERVDLPDPEDEAVTRLGDCWDFRDPRSGQVLYRACCGDSRLTETYEAALGEERADKCRTRKKGRERYASTGVRYPPTSFRWYRPRDDGSL